MYFKTKSAYVGTTSSGQQGVTGGAENVDGGQRTIGVNTTTRGKVLSAKTVAGTVTVTETRAFNGKVYSTCGSTFSFTVHRYVGAYPPHNSEPPATTPSRQVTSSSPWKAESVGARSSLRATELMQ